MGFKSVIHLSANTVQQWNSSQHLPKNFLFKYSLDPNRQRKWHKSKPRSENSKQNETDPEKHKTQSLKELDQKPKKENKLWRGDLSYEMKTSERIAIWVWKNYLISIVEFVVHEAGDDAGFADGLIAEEDQLVFRQRWDRRHFSLLLFSFRSNRTNG